MLENRFKFEKEVKNDSIEGKLPAAWCVQKHDRSLLKFVSEKGLLLSDIAEWIGLQKEDFTV